MLLVKNNNVLFKAITSIIAVGTKIIWKTIFEE